MISVRTLYLYPPPLKTLYTHTYTLVYKENQPLLSRNSIFFFVRLYTTHHANAALFSLFLGSVGCTWKREKSIAGVTFRAWLGDAGDKSRGVYVIGRGAAAAASESRVYGRIHIGVCIMEPRQQRPTRIVGVSALYTFRSGRNRGGKIGVCSWGG